MSLSPEHLKPDRRNIGFSPSAADSDETLFTKQSWAEIAIVHMIAHAPTGLTSPNVTLKDGTTLIGVWTVSAGDTIEMLRGNRPLPINGDLVVQASSTSVVISAWINDEEIV